MRYPILRAVAALIFFVLSWGLPEAVRAHAFPDHSDPKVGSSVVSSPTFVRIWFDGDLEPTFSTIMVHSMDGRMVDSGNGHVDASDPALLEVGLPKLPSGTYLVIWNVVARDGHRTQGQYTFTVR
jgi:methionine-rich copper-binding protein CopC